MMLNIYFRYMLYVKYTTILCIWAIIKKYIKNIFLLKSIIIEIYFPEFIIIYNHKKSCYHIITIYPLY